MTGDVGVRWCAANGQMKVYESGALELPGLIRKLKVQLVEKELLPPMTQDFERAWERCHHGLYEVRRERSSPIRPSMAWRHAAQAGDYNTI